MAGRGHSDPAKFLWLGLGITFLCRPARAVPQAPAERGDYVATLGRDTVALETCERTERRLAGGILLRIPVTILIRYEVTLDDLGRPRRSAMEVKPQAPGPIVPYRTAMTFDADSLRIRVDSAGATRRTALPAAPERSLALVTGFGASLGLYSSLGLHQLVLDQIRRRPEDSVRVTTIGGLTGQPGVRTYLRQSANRVDVDYFRIAWIHLLLDDDGRIDTADARETTERVIARRTGPLDLERLAKAFAARDRQGRGLGLASRRDSVRTTVDAAAIAIDYSSPRRRGRTVLDAVVPLGQVWRTGADAATTLFLSKPLRFGGTVIPAGPYSVWTLPEPGGVSLIINRQYGQWGTEYHADRDVARLPMQVVKLSTPREEFLIEVRRRAKETELVIAWDTFEWTLSIGVPP